MRIRLPRRMRRLTVKLVTAETLTAKPYALYRDPRDCDSDDWGRPKGRFATLDEAMAAAGRPGAASWCTLRDCPDETFTYASLTSVPWSILAPGAAGELEAMREMEAWL